MLVFLNILHSYYTGKSQNVEIFAFWVLVKSTKRAHEHRTLESSVQNDEYLAFWPSGVMNIYINTSFTSPITSNEMMIDNFK